MRNTMRGVNILNEQLWESREAGPVWESTGLKESGFVTHVDFKACLQWNLTRYPETDTIQAVLNGLFRLAVPSQSAAITILDAIAKQLGVTETPQPTDSTIIATKGGKKMDAPPDVRCGSCGRVPNPISAPCPDCPDRDDKER